MLAHKSSFLHLLHIFLSQEFKLLYRAGYAYQHTQGGKINSAKACLLCAKCGCMGLGVKMNKQKKIRKLQLSTKIQTKDKESSFGLEENWPGNGIKDSFNPPASTTLGSVLSWDRETPLRTHHLTHLRVIFQRNQVSVWDLTTVKINSGSVCWYGDFFSLEVLYSTPSHIRKKHREP